MNDHGLRHRLLGVVPGDGTMLMPVVNMWTSARSRPFGTLYGLTRIMVEVYEQQDEGEEAERRTHVAREPERARLTCHTVRQMA